MHVFYRRILDVAVLCAYFKISFSRELAPSDRLHHCILAFSVLYASLIFIMSLIQLSFKDIRGMVEHNTQLRTLVRTLGQQNELKEQELKVNIPMF